MAITQNHKTVNSVYTILRDAFHLELEDGRDLIKLVCYGETSEEEDVNDPYDFCE